jgi:hypothetical protein
MLTTSIESCADPIVLRPGFGGIGKSLPNWTERTTDRLEGLIFGGPAEAWGSFHTLGILSVFARVSVTANVLDAHIRSKQRLMWSL